MWTETFGRNYEQPSKKRSDSSTEESIPECKLGLL